MGRVSVRFDHITGLQAVHDARLAAGRSLRDWHLPEPVVDDALLAVSELATNAVQHAASAGDLTLELVRTGTVLRLSVSDRSLATPELRAAEGTDESGRGLAILAAVSDRWGIEAQRGGKRVWCEMDLVNRPGYAGSTSS